MITFPSQLSTFIGEGTRTDSVKGPLGTQRTHWQRPLHSGGGAFVGQVPSICHCIEFWKADFDACSPWNGTQECIIRLWFYLFIKRKKKIYSMQTPLTSILHFLFLTGTHLFQTKPFSLPTWSTKFVFQIMHFLQNVLIQVYRPTCKFKYGYDADMLMQLNIVRMDLWIQHFKKTLGAT